MRQRCPARPGGSPIGEHVLDIVRWLVERDDVALRLISDDRIVFGAGDLDLLTRLRRLEKYGGRSDHGENH